jgi:Tfp pilus assembly protein PilO
VKSAATHQYGVVAVLAGLAVVLAVGGWLVLVAPQRHHAASTAGQVRQAQDQLTQVEAAVRKAREHPKQPPIRTKALYRLQAAMPTREDVPDLLLGLDQLAGSYGVQVTTLSPATPTAAAGGYTILPVSLSLTGSYASLTRYLHKLRTLVALQHGRVVASGRLFSVTSVAMSPTGTGRQLKASVGLQAFIYGSVAGATPLPSATGTTGTSTGSTTTSGQ